MTKNFSRRLLLQQSLIAGTTLPFCGMMGWNHQTFSSSTVLATPKPKRPIPVLHLTDLFHPHGDPDDHFDLACIYSLAYQGFIELKGIGIDYPPDFRAGDPALVAVAQLNQICGLNIPTYIGSSKLVSQRNDSLPGLSKRDARGIQFILETLTNSDQPVAITVVGSATDVAAAARREPELFREKCAGVYLNSGATHQAKPEMLEHNVKLNPAAYAAMFDLPCPLYWFPCWHNTEVREPGEWGTFYWMPHQDVFEGVSGPLLSYFWYMFSRSQDPRYLRMLLTSPPEDGWKKVLTGKRGMWSPASFMTLAQLMITKEGKITETGVSDSNDLFQMVPVQATCEDNGRLQWKVAHDETNRYLFHILDVPAYSHAMTQAVRSLLLAIPQE